MTPTGRTIIHIDMDAFFAAVEIRDNPELRGKPLIIGALPSERGVVSTCSYEARVYGVRSAMSIKDAYRLCPHGIYMHPNGHKYEKASRQIGAIWSEYTDAIEHVSLDEGFLDVTASQHLFGGARNIGFEIKKKTLADTGLTCSVGIGYSLMSAKLASEEKKPDGFFEIPDPGALKNLIIDRPVRIIYGIGPQTAAELEKISVRTVRDIYDNKQLVLSFLGNHGKHIIDLAEGIDSRRVGAQSKSQSIGKEHTFQRDITDFDYLKDVLRLIARELSFQIRQKNLRCRTVTLKVTYKDMKKITRSQSGAPIHRADDIYKTAASLLEKVEKRPIRLVGISLGNISEYKGKPASLFEPLEDDSAYNLDAVMMDLQLRYGADIVKSAAELEAERRLNTDLSSRQ